MRNIASQYDLEHSFIGTDVPIWSQLRSGDILVHAGSTCALEAEAMFIPSIQLRTDDKFALDYTNQNIGCLSISDVIHNISCLLQDYHICSDNNDHDEKLFWPANTTSLDLIAQDISNMSTSYNSFGIYEILKSVLSSGLRLIPSPRETDFISKYRNKVVQHADLERVLRFSSSVPSISPLVLYESETSAPICIYS